MLNWTQIHFYITDCKVLVVMLYACYPFEFELQNMYSCSFSFPRWRNLNGTKITPSQEMTEWELESTLSRLKELVTVLLNWGPGCWHGYNNSCCSWQGRGAGRHKAWDKSLCPSCISGRTAEGRLPAVAPQAADQVQVDSAYSNSERVGPSTSAVPTKIKCCWSVRMTSVCLQTSVGRT